VAASRAFTNLAKQVLVEQDSNKEQGQENGTFSLQYTPTDVHKKLITIPLTTPDSLRHSQPNHYVEIGGQKGVPYTDIIRF